MPYYMVTATTRSTLHPRAAAKLGFSVLVPGDVHELDADVAAEFLPHKTDAPGPLKRDTKSGELVATSRKVEHPGLLAKSTKKKYEAAQADELDEGDVGDEGDDDVHDDE